MWWACRLRHTRHARRRSHLRCAAGQVDPNLGPQSRTLLQNIQVLSAGAEIQNEKDNQNKAKPVQVVNLLVNPDQAETLTLASNQGGLRIQLVLRNPLDTKTDPVVGTAEATSLASLPAQRSPCRFLRPRKFKSPQLRLLSRSSTARPGAKKNLDLPRQSRENKRWHYHRMLQRIVDTSVR